MNKYQHVEDMPVCGVTMHGDDTMEEASARCCKQLQSWNNDVPENTSDVKRLGSRLNKTTGQVDPMTSKARSVINAQCGTISAAYALGYEGIKWNHNK